MMKKILVTVMTLGILLSFCACRSNTDSAEDMGETHMKETLETMTAEEI